MSRANAIARKDALEFRRDWRLLFATILVVVLSVTALFLAHQRAVAYERDRALAEAQDRETWLGQGARNPHGAAHFNTWAFRSLTPASMIDPGVSAYGGTAIWMEAHNQNPATARVAEDRAATLDLGELSVAWVLQVLAPLLIFVIAAGLVARERERGTLRLMLASGANARQLLQQKTWGLVKLSLLVLVPLFAAAFVAAALAPTPFDSDQVQRLLLWTLMHVVYLTIIVLIAAAVSARARTVDRALLALVAMWLVATPLAPRIAASVAEIVAPMPSAASFWERVSADLGEADVFDPDDPATQALEARVLAQYGVSRVEDLPISFAGVQLDEAEKHGDAVFDRHFGALAAQAEQQRAVMRVGALLSPLIALQNVSAGLAGTDGAHHRDFAAQAEAHRRLTVGQLNADMIANAAGEDFDYIADPGLWAEIPPFAYQPPPWTALASSWLPDAMTLIGWLIFACSSRLPPAAH
jgi:ABC-2 type transport system permease protein